MEAFVFRFSARQLRAIPPHRLGFLIASGHCCNELAILLPYIIFEHDLTRANDVEVAFILTRKFTVDRIIISKIVEYGNLCSKFFRNWNSSSDELVQELKKEFGPIEEKIRTAKWARILRNKISFHYDPDHAMTAFSSLDDAHPLRLIAGKIKGITLFDFAEEIVSRPTFESAGAGDIGAGMDAANRFIVDLVGSITTFHARATISMFKSHHLLTERVQLDLREKYCATPDDIRVPLSISSAYLEGRVPTKRAKTRKRNLPRTRRSGVIA
jgi:hypothetical protein